MSPLARAALGAALVASTPGCGSESTPDEPASGGTGGAPETGLTSPKEAQDLDPDPDVVHVQLRAAHYDHVMDGMLHHGYAYDEQIPGPTLRAKVGDELVVDFQNGLEAETTIHWHGLRAPYEMDGVTWQHDPIAPGTTFTYHFKLDRAGTFWYHPHFDSAAQVDAGLYGFLVVESPDDPKADRELLVALDVMDEPTGDGGMGHNHNRSADGGMDMDGGHMGGHPAPGAVAWMANSQHDATAELRGGESVRVRLLNASNESYLDLSGAWLRQIGSDQGLLPALAQPERLLLAPGDRAELEWLVGSAGFDLTTAPYSLAGGAALGDPAPLFHVAVKDGAAAPPPLAWPFDGAAPTPDPGTTDVLYTLTGDAHHGDWRINGEQFPDVTIEELALDQDAVIELRNVSATEHPFHLHGNFFEVLATNGEPPAARSIEDTVNLAVRDVVRLRLVADNPGDWMAHCHILPHADQGMLTLLRVNAQ